LSPRGFISGRKTGVEATGVATEEKLEDVDDAEDADEEREHPDDSEEPEKETFRM
jgi:hypothetical protein